MIVTSFVQYLKDSKAELKRVNWPTKKQVVQYTTVIIAISVAVAIFLGVLDVGLGKLLNAFVF